MIVALLWLTVSTPFVYATQQETHQSQTMAGMNDTPPVAEEESNPLGSTPDEKAPSGVSVSEEYLHDHHSSEYYFSMASNYHKLGDVGVYVAFHGEMLVPPPNKA